MHVFRSQQCFWNKDWGRRAYQNCFKERNSISFSKVNFPLFHLWWWWLSLGCKDVLVYTPVSGHWNGSAASVLICRVRGRWNTRRPLSWQGQKQLCGDDCRMQASLLIVFFSSDVLALHVSAHQWGQTWAAMSRSEGLMPFHFRLLFSVSLYHLCGWPCFLCPCASSPKNTCFGMHSLPIEMTWPPQQSWGFSSITSMEVDLAQSRTSRLAILSCHQILKMEWSAHIWNFSSCLIWLQQKVQDSQLYNTDVSTVPAGAHTYL